jgi:hypothetical protein
MVFIRGTNLEEMGTLTVYFGNKRAQKTGVTRAGEHWAIAPPNATEGLFDVRIVGADGDAYLLPLGFEYVKHADMAECVNISHQINGTMVPKRQEK